MHFYIGLTIKALQQESLAYELYIYIRNFEFDYSAYLHILLWVFTLNYTITRIKCKITIVLKGLYYVVKEFERYYFCRRGTDIFKI